MDDRSDGAFFSYARTVVEAGRLQEEAAYVQHGSTSTLLHSIAVAYLADAIARATGYTDHLNEVRRAALLHDYYLYDWHDRAPEHRRHATLHPLRALENALRDYPDLTEREADAIATHMFPVTARMPRYGVGWCVTCADKRCAAYESVDRWSLSYPRLRDLCGFFLPGLDLGSRDASPLRGMPCPPIPTMPSLLPVPAVALVGASRLSGRLRGR